MVTLDTGNRFCNNTKCVGVSQNITQEETFLTGAPLHITDERFTHVYQKVTLLEWVLKITFTWPSKTTSWRVLLMITH